MSQGSEDPRHAEELLIELISEDRTSPTDGSELDQTLASCLTGERALLEGRPYEAAVAFRDATSYGHTSPLSRAGHDYVVLEASKSLVALDALVADWPQLETPRLRRGLRRLSNGDAAGALEDARVCLERQPNDPRALLLYGRARLAKGQREEAVDAAERIQRLAPGSVLWRQQAVLLLGGAHAYRKGWHLARDTSPMFRGIRSHLLAWTFFFSSAKVTTQRRTDLLLAVSLLLIGGVLILSNLAPSLLFGFAALTLVIVVCRLMVNVANDTSTRRRSTQAVRRLRESSTSG